MSPGNDERPGGHPGGSSNNFAHPEATTVSGDTTALPWLTPPVLDPVDHLFATRTRPSPPAAKQAAPPGDFVEFMVAHRSPRAGQTSTSAVTGHEAPGEPTPITDPAAWAAKALDEMVTELAATAEGARDDTVNKHAFTLGRYVAGGLPLDRDEVETRLYEACEVNGYTSDRSHGDALTKIRRSMADGERHPYAWTQAPRTELAPQWHAAGPTQTQPSIFERYPPLVWADVFARLVVEVEWLCEPLIEAGCVVACYSPAKSGKSLLGQEISAALAAGRPVLGNPVREPVVVLYVDLENGVNDIRERLVALGYGPDDLGNLRYLSFPSFPALDSPQGGRELHAVAMAHGARLVVIDTVSRVIEGEENDADTFRALYRHAVMPLKAAGVAVLRLDHSGKDVTKGQRGSSGKNDDVDAVWQLTKRTETCLDLRRTHQRNNHGAAFVSLVRREDPLRHEVATTPAMGAEVAALVAELNRLGVPVEAGRGVAGKALRDAGVSTSTATLAEAIKARKQAFDLSGTGPEPNGYSTPRPAVPVPVRETP